MIGELLVDLAVGEGGDYYLAFCIRTTVCMYIRLGISDWLCCRSIWEREKEEKTVTDNAKQIFVKDLVRKLGT